MTETPLLHAELTGAILNAYQQVWARLQGRRYQERAYRQALATELTQRGYAVAQEVPVTHRYRGQPIGDGYLDLLVAGQVGVELKVGQTLTSAQLAQLRAYLAAGPWAVGLLLLFGGARPAFRRAEHRAAFPPDWPPAAH